MVVPKTTDVPKTTAAPKTTATPKITATIKAPLNYDPPPPYTWMKILLLLELGIFACLSVWVVRITSRLVWSEHKAVEESMEIKFWRQVTLFVLFQGYIVHSYLLGTLGMAIKHESPNAVNRWFALRALLLSMTISGLLSNFLITKQWYSPGLFIAIYMLCSLHMVYEYKKCIVKERIGRQVLARRNMAAQTVTLTIGVTEVGGKLALMVVKKPESVQGGPKKQQVVTIDIEDLQKKKEVKIDIPPEEVV